MSAADAWAVFLSAPWTVQATGALAALFTLVGIVAVGTAGARAVARFAARCRRKHQCPGRAPDPGPLPVRARANAAPAWALDPLDHALEAHTPSARAVSDAVEELIVWAGRQASGGRAR